MRQLKKMLVLIALLHYTNANAQIIQYPTPSNLRVVVYPNSISPLDCNYINNTSSESVLNHVQDLKSGNEATLSGVLPNVFCTFPINSNQTGILQSSYFSGKFYFDGISDVGIDTGIILSTGMIKTYCRLPAVWANGMPFHTPGIPNPAIYHGGGDNGGGFFGSGSGEPPHVSSWLLRDTQYAELVALNNGDSIWDANVLEFDFVPKGNFISLDYVFASEEWPNYHCSGNGADVMGIFLSGPGIVGQKNIATLPGSNTPVTTQTVFPAGSFCHPENSGAASPYYIDNTGGQNIIFNGFTKVLTAASQVQPCQTYHIKIMVADGVKHPNYHPTIDAAYNNPNSLGYKGLFLFDSGVLLRMRSLRSMDSIRIEALGGTQGTAAYPYSVRGCLNGKLRITAQKVLPISRTFQLSLGGTAMAGVDYQNINTTVTIPAGDSVVDINIVPLTSGSGNKTLEAKILSPYGACSDWGMYLDSTHLVIADGYYASITPQDTTVCPGCSVQLQAHGEPFLSYQWTPNTYLNQSNIANPLSSPQQSIQYTLATIAPANYPCPNGSNTVQVNVGGLGIEEVKNDKVKIYPNPFKEGFQIGFDYTKGDLNVKITDVLGRTVYQTKGSITDINIKLSLVGNKLSPGNYIFELRAGIKLISQQKVNKQ